jgi:hypothetical protein
MTYIIGKPYSLILLEVEEAITGKGENRPLIVEAAYRKIIKEYGENLTEDEKVCLGAFRIIMEELALKNVLQIDAARAIQEKDLVQRWGMNKIPGWADLKPDQQLARLLGGITSQAKAKAHEVIVADGKPVQGSAMKFDFEDPKIVADKIAKIFLNDILAQNEAP